MATVGDSGEYSIVKNPTRLGMTKVTVEGRGVAATKTIEANCKPIPQSKLYDLQYGS